MIRPGVHKDMEQRKHSYIPSESVNQYKHFERQFTIIY